jgi:L-ascorbate metabolism protein UlaG (beta-lactamase superfamily)
MHLFISMLSFFIIGIMFFAYSAEALTPQEMVKNITWFGQASLRIKTAEKINIYIDPYKLKKPDTADIILITHDHPDHYSENDIAKLTAKNQIIIAPFDIKGKNKILLPGKSITVKGVKIETVPAYNIVKTKFHPKTKNYVGYILTIDGVRIYDSGDTEKIPEMKNIKCDIAFFPLGQTYTMGSVQEAIDAALMVKPKIAIPFHFGLAEGTTDDAKKFVSELTKKGITSFIMKQE